MLTFDSFSVQLREDPSSSGLRPEEGACIKPSFDERGQAHRQIHPEVIDWKISLAPHSNSEQIPASTESQQADSTVELKSTKHSHISGVV